MSTTVSLIAAISSNGVIGHNGDLPWVLPDDFKRFRKMTTGKTVIMGRKTFESISRPLPDRQNIVITSHPWLSSGIDHASNVIDAVNKSRSDDTFIIGGKSVYHDAMPLAQRMFLTVIHADVIGDTSFPFVDWRKWERIYSEYHESDSKHAFSFSFRDYVRCA